MLATLLRTPMVIGTFTMPIQDRPSQVRVSPDGRSIAVSTNNGGIRVYDTHTHRQTAKFAEFNFFAEGNFFDYTYVPTSGDLFVGGLTPTLVDPRTGRTLRKFTTSNLWHQAEQAGTALPFQPAIVTQDGRYGFQLWSAFNKDGSMSAYIESWKLDHGGPSHLVRLGRTGMIAATALPHDRLIVATTDGQIVTWDTKTEKAIHHVPGPRLSSDTAAAISPDGRILAYNLSDGTFHFFDIRHDKPVVSQGEQSGAVAAFSPDSRSAVSFGPDGPLGPDGLGIVWDPSTGQPRERLPAAHSGAIDGAAFSRDGQTLFTAGSDGTILEYDLGGTRRFGRPFRLPPTPLAQVLAVSPNGRLFGASSEVPSTTQSSVELYSVSPLRRVGAIVVPKGRSVGAGAWAGNRFVLGSDRGRVQLWDVARGRPRPGPVLHGVSPKGEVSAVAVALGGRVVAASDVWGGYGRPEQDDFAIWRDGRLVGGKPLHLRYFGAIALSADGATAAVATVPFSPPGNRTRVLIVDALTGRVERTIRPKNAAGSVTALAFAPDGTLATGAWSGIVNLWNPKTGQAIGHPTLVAQAPVASISFSPDGSTFATSSGGARGNETRIWLTSTQQQLGADLPGGAPVGNVAYTPVGRYLIAIYSDGTGYRWPVSLGAWQNHACAVAGRNLTLEEWRRFVGSRSYSRVCPQFPAGH